MSEKQSASLEQKCGGFLASAVDRLGVDNEMRQLLISPFREIKF